DEVSPDLETALRFARELGLGWVEIRSLGGQYATDLSLEDIREARARIDSFGIKVSVLDTVLHRCAIPGTRLRKPTRDDRPYAEQGALLDRAIERSQILGTRFIRVFSFWRVEEPETAFDAVVEHLHRAVERASRAEGVLLLENVEGANVQTSAEAAKVLAAIPSPNFAQVWDP